MGTTTKYLRGAAGIGLGTAIKYLRRTMSAAAGSSLGTTINYLRGATGIGLGTTIRYLRRTASGAAGSGLALRSSTCDAQRAAPRATTGRDDQVLATHNERRRGQRIWHHDQVPRETKRGRGQQLDQGPLHKGLKGILLNFPVF
jgi:hypothetical protein